MTSINQVANYANGCKKPSKKQAYSMLCELIENNQDADNILQLQNLYAFFMPGIPATAKDAFSLALKYKAKQDVRYFLTYVNVDSIGRIQATNGHAIVRFKGKSDLLPGQYDNAKQRIDDDVAGNYPEVDRVIPRPYNLITCESYKKELIVWPNGDHVYKITFFDGCGNPTESAFKKELWDLAEKHILDEGTIKFQTGFNSVLFEDSEKEQVIMPTRM